MMTRGRRIFAACLATALILAASTRLRSRNRAKIRDHPDTVKSATKHRTASQRARVLLGPASQSALTTRSGIVKYTDVASGIYRVRVNKPVPQQHLGRVRTAGQQRSRYRRHLGLVGRQRKMIADRRDRFQRHEIIGRVAARVTVSTHDVR